MLFSLSSIEPREVASTVERLELQEAKSAVAALPAPVGTAFALVVDGGKALITKLSRVTREGPLIDIGFDNRFGGLHQIAEGIVRFGRGAGYLPLGADMAERVALAERIASNFTGPDLKWLNAPYIDEWREGRYRLVRLDEADSAGRPTLRECFSRLGLTAELGAAVASHTKLGEVLGITDAVSDVSEDVLTWNKRVSAFLVALAHHAADDVESQASAVWKWLVKPFDDAWERQRSRRRRATATAEATPPVEGSTTTS